MGLVKKLGIALYILCNFNLENTEYTLYFIAGLIGLIARLGLKGIVEEIILSSSHMTMGGSPSIGSSQGVDGSSLSATVLPDSGTPTPVAPVAPAPAPASSAPAPASSAPAPAPTPASPTAPTPTVTTPTATAVPTAPAAPTAPSAYATRMATVFQNEIKRVSDDIKVISSKMANCEDENKKMQMEDEINESLERLSMLSISTVEELKKTVPGLDSINSNKRDSDFVDQGSSKKKS
jgi:hypothetical protein